ncbi:Holliday junction branch migration protein RuvA [Campylobacter sp. MIT 12-8780]|uniref:Holliday junction branch migration protein RuvA n=1 Tax=unclassified Campylobacter TaxID=2593542 RepID=UPI00115CF163|nr:MULTISPECIES: Holliday junction branch migration protein RuvA [unclassified Campylobacter]NDJ27526.1 Holliday junction branch migration protein RuvA [Campylobacter sp. MIT 19-121]TQR41282.1 Holliday junction branch migration protein RuvA [Campylobacter sp. MIT 12-8780]
MVAAIEGIITYKEPTFAIIKTSSGVSYGVHVSLFCTAKLEKGQKIELLTSPIIKEDSQKLYGFLDKNEQKMFELLLKVNGVGASTALAICSTLDTNSFYQALSLGDESAFIKVPGIGAKSAKRIIVELADKQFKFESVDDHKSQALAALVSLGFNQSKAISVLAKCDAKETSELVKQALKQLS